EVESAVWKPLAPISDAAMAERIVFVDGVRRVEARVLARDRERIIHGAFGTYGVGAVIVTRGSATWGPENIDRVLALSGGMSLSAAQEITSGVTYRPVSSPDDDPDAPLKRLQEEMRLAEGELARQMGAEETLVIGDGPLRFDDQRGATIGYVKRF